MSRGGDSQDALRAVWMEGYRAGLAAGAKAPKVCIAPRDLETHQLAECGNATCPVCRTIKAVQSGCEACARIVADLCDGELRDHVTTMARVRLTTSLRERA